MGDALVSRPIQFHSIQVRTMKNDQEKDPLLDELAERIAEGPIVFTPDEEFLKRVAERRKEVNKDEDT
mgnify:FL=1